jgi:hypothetical protein
MEREVYASGRGKLAGFEYLVNVTGRSHVSFEILENSLQYACGNDEVFLRYCSQQRRRRSMPDEQRVANNSQTYVAEADTFQFETLKQENGQATVIRFRLEDPRYHAGDVLVVLSGSEIHFHGMIGQLADGWAIASDPRGSLLAATVQ